MSSLYYSAAWTECSCLITCSHHHHTVSEAAACIRSAGGYVVAVHRGVMRFLTAAEEAEFPVVRHPRHNPAAETTPIPSEAAVDSRYAVMTRIRVGDRWTWTTWMCFETCAEAAAHARQGNRVVRFRSPEWAVLRHQFEAASPILVTEARASLPPRDEAETLVEFVLRFLSAHGFSQAAKRISDVKHSSITPDRQPFESQKDNRSIFELDEQELVTEQLQT